MKNFVAGTLALTVLLVLAFGSMAHAQAAERVIKVNIPFEFNVGNQTFSAGNYLVVRVAPALLQLRDREGRTLTTVVTNSVQALNRPASPKLRFYTDGGRHTLAQVWQEDDSIGQELRAPKSRTTVAKRRPESIQSAQAGNAQ